MRIAALIALISVVSAQTDHFSIDDGNLPHQDDDALTFRLPGVSLSPILRSGLSSPRRVGEIEKGDMGGPRTSPVVSYFEQATLVPSSTHRQLYQYTSIHKTWNGSELVNNRRTTYTYSSTGNLLNYLVETWDGTAYKNYYRYTFTYDDSDNQLTQTYDTWDGSQWVGAWYYTYTYNASNQRTSYLQQYWETNAWVNNYLGTFTYDEFGNSAIDLYQTWDGSQWVDDYSYTYTFDGQGYLTHYLYKYWDGTQLVNSNLYTYTRDASGFITNFLSQSWDGSAWVNSSYRTYTPDANGWRSTFLYQTWDGTTWVDSRLYTYNYTVDGWLLYFLRQTWDTDAWVNDYQYFYRRDEQNKILEFLYQDWVEFQWVNVYQYLYAYDSEGNQIQYKYSVWGGTDWVISSIYFYEYLYYGLNVRFSADVTDGDYPLEVNFTDESFSTDAAAIASWEWDFDGDGAAESTERHPAHTFAYPGDYDITLTIGDGTNSESYTAAAFIRIDYPAAPTLLSIDDTPEDQGGSVTVHFWKSNYDNGTLLAKSTGTESYTVEMLSGAEWVALATTGAYGADTYHVMVNTPMDSSATAGYMLDFRVIAFMEEGNFASDTLAAYSVDNLAPPAATNLVRAYDAKTLILTIGWDAAQANDVYGYHAFEVIDGVWDGTAPVDFTSDLTLAIATPKDGQDHRYVIITEDVHNNLSVESHSVSTSTLALADPAGIPVTYNLHPNYPNPFNPGTRIRFDMPEAARISIIVYDLVGREITRLVDGVLPAGYQSVNWSGRDARGGVVPTGVYIARLETATYSQAIKMVLMK